MNLKAIPFFSPRGAPPEDPRVRFNADGSVEVGRIDGEIEFNFSVFGLQFAATTCRTGRATLLQLTAKLGPVPYSAEGAGARRAATAIVAASHFLAGARLVVSRQHWIYFIGASALPDGWQPSDAIVAGARLALEAKPYLAMLTEVLPAWRR